MVKALRCSLLVGFATLVSGDAVAQLTPQAQVVVAAPVGLTIQDGYDLVELTTATGRNSYCNAIGPGGQVAGADKVPGEKETRAVAWTAAGGSSFPPGGVPSETVGFAQSGEPVGYRYSSAVFDFEGFRGNTSLEGIALGVGANGRIVGYKKNKNGKAQAWGTSSADVFKPVPNFTESWAFDVNATGVAVGYAGNGHTPGTPLHPVRWKDSGTAVVLPGKGAGQLGGAVSINDKGVAVGWVGDGDGQRAARWDANDQLTELGSLGGKSTALGINNAGAIVGYANDANGDVHGVVIRNGKMIDLNTVIHRPTLETTKVAASDRISLVTIDWFFQSANGINDKGEICGWATKQGKSHAVVLKPTTKTIPISTLEEINRAIQSSRPPRAVMNARETPPADKRP